MKKFLFVLAFSLVYLLTNKVEAFEFWMYERATLLTYKIESFIDNYGEEYRDKIIKLLTKHEWNNFVKYVLQQIDQSRWFSSICSDQYHNCFWWWVRLEWRLVSEETENRCASGKNCSIVNVLFFYVDLEKINNNDFIIFNASWKENEPEEFRNRYRIWCINSNKWLYAEYETDSKIVNESIINKEIKNPILNRKVMLTAQIIKSVSSWRWAWVCESFWRNIDFEYID